MGGMFSVDQSMSDDETSATLIQWLTINTQCVSTQPNGKNKPVNICNDTTQIRTTRSNDFSKVI